MKEQQKTHLIGVLGALIVSFVFQLNEVQAFPSLCSTLSQPQVITLSRKEKKKVSKQIMATLNVGSRLPNPVRRAALAMKKKSSGYKQMYNSPATTLMYAFADYYQINELKRRAGNVRVPFIPLETAVKQLESYPLTAETLAAQAMDPNLDTESDPTKALQVKTVFSALESSEITKKLKAKFDEQLSLVDEVGSQDRYVDTTPLFPSFDSFPNGELFFHVNDLETNFDHLTREERERLARNLAVMTQLTQEEQKGSMVPMVGNFDSIAKEFVEKSSAEQQQYFKAFENVAVPAPRSEKEQKEFVASLQESFKEIFRIGPAVTINDQIQFGHTPSYVPTIGADLATAKYIGAKFIKDLSDLYQEKEAVDGLTKARREPLTEKTASILAETLYKHEKFVADFVEHAPVTKEQAQKFLNKALTQDDVKAFVNGPLNRGWLQKLSNSIGKEEDTLKSRYRNLQRLISGLENLQVASQQISLSGLKMVEERTEAMKKLKKLKAPATFKTTEAKSIELVLGLTSPIPLGPQKDVGLMQQYISKLAGRLVNDWRSTAGKERIFFDNELVKEATNLYFQKICVPNYNTFLKGVSKF